MLGVRGGGATGQGADCVVLGPVCGGQWIVPGIGLHVVQMVLLVVFVDEGLLLALLLQLLVRLLLRVAACEANGGGAGVVVAQVNLHAWLRLLALGLVDVRGTGEDVDLLVKARVIVEVVVEAAVPALAALIGLLGVVTRLVQVVLVDEAGAGVDDLATRAGHSVHAGRAVPSWDCLLVPRLPRVQVGHLQLRLLPLRALVICSIIYVRLLQAGRPLVGLRLSLPMCLAWLLMLLFRSRLIVQIVGAALDILLLIPVDVLVCAAQYYGLAHVRVVVDLAALVVAPRTHASTEKIALLLGKLGGVLLLVMVLGLLRLVDAIKGIGIEVAVVLLRHGLS